MYAGKTGLETKLIDKDIEAQGIMSSAPDKKTRNWVVGLHDCWNYKDIKVLTNLITSVPTDK